MLETILSLIRRGIPLRWGIVPQTATSGALEQAKVVYYLHDAYGLPAVIEYLQVVSVEISCEVDVALTWSSVGRWQEAGACRPSHLRRDSQENRAPRRKGGFGL